MEKLIFIVERTNDEISAYAEEYDIYATAKNENELIKIIVEAANLHFAEIDEAPVSAKDIVLKAFDETC